MTIVDLRMYRNSALTPTVILIDLQQEYISPQRALGLGSAAAAVEKCRQLLAFARACRFPVAHVRWTQSEIYFNKQQSYSQWIPDLGPRGADMVFERSMPSCYAARSFAEMMEHGGGQNAVIAGFTGSIACLSTAIDAYHRNHTVTFLSDASASHAIGAADEAEAHRYATDIISLYAPVATTDDWIAQFSNEREGAGSAR